MTVSNYWYARLLTACSWRPLRLGLTIVLVLLLIFVSWSLLITLTGIDLRFSPEQLSIEVLAIAISGYSVAVTAHSLRVTPEDIRSLAPVLALAQGELDQSAQRIVNQGRPLHIWTLGWIVITVLITLSGYLTTVDDYVKLPAAWPYFRNVVFVFSLSQLCWIEWIQAHRFGRLLYRHGKVNLLDRSGFQPLARRARRGVLLWIPLVPITLGFMIVAAGVLLMPAWGIHKRYAAAKQQELENVRLRIRQRGATVVDGAAITETTGLPELVAWEQRLERARTWPYDLTTFLRVIFYAAIGLASWTGAALVERFIGQFFA